MKILLHKDERQRVYQDKSPQELRHALSQWSLKRPLKKL